MLRSVAAACGPQATTLDPSETAAVQPHFLSNEFLAAGLRYKKDEWLLQEKTARQGYCAEATSTTIEGGSALSAAGILDWPAFLGARTNTTAVSS